MTHLLLLVCCALSASGIPPVSGVPLLAVPSNETLATFPSLEPRIVGGSVMTQPISYQVSLRAQNYPPDIGPVSLSHYCGGALISETHVLTAAHCFDGILAEYMKMGRIFAVMGTVDLMFNPDATFVSMVQAAIVHPKYDRYNSSEHHDDIAVIKLVDTAPVSLPGIAKISYDTDPPRVGRRCTVSGWGYEKFRGNANSPILKAAKVPIVDTQLCTNRYSERGGKVTEDMLCAGEEVGGADSCQGDSGGPLVCGGKVTGVVSWGINCGRPQIPGIYASVPYYSPWLAESMRQLDELVTPRPPEPVSLTATRSTMDIRTCLIIFTLTVTKYQTRISEI